MNCNATTPSHIDQMSQSHRTSSLLSNKMATKHQIYRFHILFALLYPPRPLSPNTTNDLLPRGPTDTSTDNTGQLLATNRVHHADDSRDEERKHDTGSNEQPEWNRDVLLLTRGAGPVGHLAALALAHDGRLASAAVTVLLRLVLGLVQELALAVAGAVLRDLLAGGERVEEGREDAANGAVGLLVRGEDGEVLEIGVVGLGVGGCRGLGCEGEEGLGVLAVAARLDGGGHLVAAVGGDYAALGVGRRGRHGDKGDVETAGSEAGQGVLEDVALDVIVLVGAENGQVLVVEGGLLERGEG
jgi:hypothetical protein